MPTRPDRRAEIAALQAFLTADPDRWPELAPRAVESSGHDLLRRIVDATRERLGGIDEVRDSPRGLLVAGPRGEVLAWAKIDQAGTLEDLLIARGAEGYGPGGWWRRRLATAVWVALCCYWIALCWGAGSVTGWIGSLLVVASGYLLLEGFSSITEEPWWVRRPVEAGALVALGSAWRLPHLRVGNGTFDVVVGVAMLGLTAGALLRSRRHRWGTAVTAQAWFPLRGAWYVGQGGGRLLNHHFQVPEQRGALDLVKVGATGSRRGSAGSLGSYLAYGARVYAPCDGRVVSAVDGVEDQVPGVIRYGPVYGNHVFIDTGTETVKLAHLRPGTVAVAQGQSVRAGDLLGEVGNSGNTTEPHLHIHAERDGVGLDLDFVDVQGSLHRGRTVRT
ncbi:M23 family metallopeptidase [Streptacidiphilus sp. N1-10]|uniref:M23 family metallopeptidase n=1 Tax=Streptacidiphilus jeojiensis TaxID=3229225 RepID=A0ABV6XY61_9ACTN